MTDIYQLLQSLNISFQKHEHPAVFTVEEAAAYDRGFAAGRVRICFCAIRKVIGCIWWLYKQKSVLI